MHEALNEGLTSRRDALQRLIQAEQDTAATLSGLGTEWVVLHSVPVGPEAGTLAHLAIGPGGVFAIVSIPPPATVIDVVDGQWRSSLEGIGEALSRARRLAERAQAALPLQPGQGAADPAVHPVVSVTGCPPPHQADVRDSVPVVPVHRLAAHVLGRPRRTPLTTVQRLAARAADPDTWDAPQQEWLPPDLQDRYADMTGPGSRMPRDLTRSASRRVLAGTVTAAEAPRLPARGPAVRAASVTMVLLGVSSLGTGGVLSLPSLAYGQLFLRRRGGLAWLNDKDASLFLVGMVLAGLPLLFWLLLLPVVLGGAT